MADYYCTLDDVNALVPQAPFSETTRPTAASVKTFIQDIARRIDATIKNVGYEVPVTTGVNSLGLLREAAAWGALGLAQNVRMTAVREATNERGVPVENLWTTKFERWLKKLTDPQDPFELPDATRTGDQLVKQPADVLRSHVQGDVERFATSPVVTRDQVL